MSFVHANEPNYVVLLAIGRSANGKRISSAARPRTRTSSDSEVLLRRKSQDHYVAGRMECRVEERTSLAYCVRCLSTFGSRNCGPRWEHCEWTLAERCTCIQASERSFSSCSDDDVAQQLYKMNEFDIKDANTRRVAVSVGADRRIQVRTTKFQQENRRNLKVSAAARDWNLRMVLKSLTALYDWYLSRAAAAIRSHFLYSESSIVSNPAA